MSYLPSYLLIQVLSWTWHWEKSSKVSHKKWNVWTILFFMIITSLSKCSTTLGIISVYALLRVLLLITKKFQFCKKTVIFPGLNITPSGITPSSNILSAIREFLSHKISQVPVLEIMGGQWSLTARIWYMNAQKAFTMIKVTAEFFLISKIKFSFNLGSVPLN